MNERTCPWCGSSGTFARHVRGEAVWDTCLNCSWEALNYRASAARNPYWKDPDGGKRRRDALQAKQDAAMMKLLEDGGVTVFSGCIHVGDQFEWAPYGTPGWPHAWARIAVVDIVRRPDGSLMIAARSLQPEQEDPTWHEERWFRENVGNREQPWKGEDTDA